MESLKDALANAHSSFSDRNPASYQAYLTSRKHLPGGNTRTVLHADPFPITFASGDGCTLTSLDGHRYVDFLSEYTAGIYGHSNQVIRTAIADALDQGWSLGGNTLYEKELAKLVCERFQPTVELVRFTNSGTEANMMAVATAMAWTGKKKILVFEKGYHGATLSFRTPPPGAPYQDMNLPHEWVVGTYNDVASTQRLLSELPSNSLAAILVEPMLGSGGAIPGSLPFLQLLRAYASSHGALLIFDEVMTSRLSYRGLGHKLGIQPDMMTLGKYLGGGMSSGAFGGRADVMAMYDPTKNGGVAHPGTFNNNVISMAGGCAGCKVLNEQTTKRLNDLGELLKEKVQCAIDEALGFKRAIQESKTDDIPLELPMYITGIGSILSIHLTSPGLLSLFYHHMLSEGIYLAERGFIALNIELGVADVERFVASTGNFVKCYKGLITQT
ncbi:MAG: hypothetical protein Q9207_000156 [Kuettlingeria erythrocarpa]